MVKYEVILKITREETKTINMEFSAPVHIGEYIHAENDEFKVSRVTHHDEQLSVIYAA